MALIQMNYNSKALFRTVPVNVILPADRFDSDTDTYTKDTSSRRFICSTACWEIIPTG